MFSILYDICSFIYLAIVVYACKNGYLSLLNFLLSFTSDDINSNNKYVIYHAFDIACINKQTEIVYFLIDNYRYINWRDHISLYIKDLFYKKDESFIRFILNICDSNNNFPNYFSTDVINTKFYSVCTSHNPFQDTSTIFNKIHVSNVNIDLQTSNKYANKYLNKHDTTFIANVYFFDKPIIITFELLKDICRAAKHIQKLDVVLHINSLINNIDFTYDDHAIFREAIKDNNPLVALWLSTKIPNYSVSIDIIENGEISIEKYLHKNHIQYNHAKIIDYEIKR